MKIENRKLLAGALTLIFICGAITFLIGLISIGRWFVS